MTLSLELASLVLSLVALIVTGIGFFASLRFYRDGMETQQAVDRLLAKVESKVENISTQVGGLFETTLKAALARPAEQVQAQAGEAVAGEGRPTPFDVLRDELAADRPPGSTFVKLFFLRGLKFTDVNEAVGRVFFEMGREQGFHLLDGHGQVVYYGHFHRLEDGADIVGRIRTLLGRLADTWRRLAAAPEDPRRDNLLSLLRITSVCVLIPGALDAARVAQKVEAFQPQEHPMPVRVLTPEMLDAELRAEYERMQP